MFIIHFKSQFKTSLFLLIVLILLLLSQGTFLCIMVGTLVHLHEMDHLTETYIFINGSLDDVTKSILVL